MDRRGFLSLLGMTTGGVLLDQSIPFNRVWSFPKNITIAKHPFDYSNYLTVTHQLLATHEVVVNEAMRIMSENVKLISYLSREYNADFAFFNGAVWP